MLLNAQQNWYLRLLVFLFACRMFARKKIKFMSFEFSFFTVFYNFRSVSSVKGFLQIQHSSLRDFAKHSFSLDTGSNVFSDTNFRVCNIFFSSSDTQMPPEQILKYLWIEQKAVLGEKTYVHFIRPDLDFLYFSHMQSLCLVKQLSNIPQVLWVTWFLFRGKNSALHQHIWFGWMWIYGVISLGVLRLHQQKCRFLLVSSKQNPRSIK